MANEELLSSQGQQANEAREELLTVQEVSEELRVDPTTVRRWIKSGALEAISLPHPGKRNAYRIRRRTIRALYNANVQTVDQIAR